VNVVVEIFQNGQVQNFVKDIILKRTPKILLQDLEKILIIAEFAELIFIEEVKFLHCVAKNAQAKRIELNLNLFIQNVLIVVLILLFQIIENFMVLNIVLENADLKHWKKKLKMESGVGVKLEILLIEKEGLNVNVVDIPKIPNCLLFII